MSPVFNVVESQFQPSKLLFSGLTSTCVNWKCTSLLALPLMVYSVQTFNVLKASSTSAFVIITLVTPLSMQVYFKATRSIHPQRRGLPVVAPNSLPVLRSSSPVSSFNSVGKGPPPTLVQYAFVTPSTLFIFWGATPRPEHTPAEIVLDEVTNGKVPKSISSIVPCAPSAKTFLPLVIWLLIKYSPLIIFSVRKNSTPSKKSSSHCDISSIK